MMGYKDRSWCAWSDKCKNESCDRKFKPSDREEAIKWWGQVMRDSRRTDFPLMVADLQTKECGAKL